MKCSCQRNEDEEIVVVCPDHGVLIEAEREACAMIAEAVHKSETEDDWDLAGRKIAAAIRARRNSSNEARHA